MGVVKPTVEWFLPYEIPGKNWGTELVVARTDTYLAKVMWMRAGATGPLQYHERKDETSYILSGRAVLTYDDGLGNLMERELGPGNAVHIPPGAVHKMTAITDCVIVEGSNPVFEDRVNMDAAYAQKVT